MPRRFLMSDLEARCRKRVDHPESTGPISTTQWAELMSEQYGDLYSVVAEAGLSYFEYTLQFTTTGAAYVSEPADHLATVGFEFIDPAGTRRPLKELMAQERARWTGLTGDAQRYAMIDDRIYLYPTPPAGQTYELLYIPQPPNLGEYIPSDIVDVVTPDGEAFLIWGVAVKAHGILESDAQLAMVERDKARERLVDWAIMRAFNSSRHQIVETAEESDYFDQSDWRWR
jgi:hypothetical protein